MTLKNPKAPPNPNAPIRRENGTLIKGTGALNPGGRPKGIERKVKELVDAQFENWDGKSLDGWEAMTMTMYAIAMGKMPPGDTKNIEIRLKDRMAAIEFLFDRVHGKPTVKVESDTTLTTGGLANLNVEALDPDELQALEDHVDRLAAKMSGKATGTIIDVESDDE